MITFLNSKVEMKKLRLNENKSKKMHLGKENILCPELQVRGKKMEKSELEKYLGNQISADCSIKSTIAARHDIGIGIVAQIMSLLDQVTLGEHYFETAMLLREAFLVNGVLFGVEAFHNVTKDDVKQLEAVDEILLRRILAGHSKYGDLLHGKLGPFWV